MKIKSVTIRNFRCIQKATLHVGSFTSMVGPNGVGKSTFLRSLELFYEPSPRISIDDFFAGDHSAELSVTVAYSDLSAEAQTLFAKYVVDHALAVERIFVMANGKVVSRFHGAAPRHSQFKAVREGLEVKDRGKTARAAYDALRAQTAYESLPEWSTIADVPAALSAWELANPEQCVRERDEGQFFGFGEVGQGYLGRFTRLLYIPAVREASVDAAEARGSILTSLMDLVVRSALTSNPAFRRLQSRSQLLYERLTSSSQQAELASLGDQLSSNLKLYVPDAGVALNWRPLGAVELPMPTADIRLVEGEYHTSVERTGHGLQRAFIMTMLQHLTKVKTTQDAAASSVDESSYPNLVLAIEEPELYQHPARQRHLAKTLAQLADGSIPGVSQATQIICATHSPLFVSVDRIAEVRLLRRESKADSSPRATRVISTDLNRLAKIIWKADGEPHPAYSAATLLPRLKPIMTPWVNEGFFADVVVLVEGEDDRAALIGTSQALGLDMDGHGFAILPCGGKTCLDRPYAIFSELGIPTFLLWDGDKGEKDARPEDNHRLLRLVGRPVVDWPAEVSSAFACFECDLEATMRSELGADVYDKCLAACQAEFAIPKRKHAKKNPTVVSRLVENAKNSGRTSKTLETIVSAIHALR